MPPRMYASWLWRQDFEKTSRQSWGRNRLRVRNLNFCDTDSNKLSVWQTTLLYDWSRQTFQGNIWVDSLGIRSDGGIWKVQTEINDVQLRKVSNHTNLNWTALFGASFILLYIYIYMDVCTVCILGRQMTSHTPRLFGSLTIRSVGGTASVTVWSWIDDERLLIWTRKWRQKDLFVYWSREEIWGSSCVNVMCVGNLEGGANREGTGNSPQQNCCRWHSCSSSSKEGNLCRAVERSGRKG